MMQPVEYDRDASSATRLQDLVRVEKPIVVSTTRRRRTVSGSALAAATNRLIATCCEPPYKPPT
jgi:hypothetical protein